jgi:hypothetical protein
MDENTKVEDTASELSPEETQVDTSAEEQEVEQEAVEEQADTSNDDAVEEVTEAPEEPTVSRREDRRVKNLIEKLQSTGSELRQAKQQQQYKPLDYNEGEYDVDQLRADRDQFANQRYEEGQSTAIDLYRQERWQEKLEADEALVASKNPVLDRNSDKFDPDTTSIVNETYLATIGFDKKTGKVANPNLRYTDFVDGFLYAVERVADSRTADTTTEVAKQVSKAGVRPTASTKKGFVLKPGAIAAMSAEEYEKNRVQIQKEINRGFGI